MHSTFEENRGNRETCYAPEATEPIILPVVNNPERRARALFRKPPAKPKPKDPRNSA
ncbi:MAG: hypothetical protein OXN97_19470 [Bryobacterales bacterium]|nr:hypothetical protein [Bryobacterales bacterium]